MCGDGKSMAIMLDHRSTAVIISRRLIGLVGLRLNPCHSPIPSCICATFFLLKCYFWLSVSNENPFFDYNQKTARTKMVHICNRKQAHNMGSNFVVATNWYPVKISMYSVDKSQFQNYIQQLPIPLKLCISIRPMRQRARSY